MRTTEVQYRDVVVDGVRLRITEAGSGPTVLLLHGFPQSAYTWRHQIRALAAAGYHAVAPDQRGYAGSDTPEGAETYTIMHLVGDAIAVLDAVAARDPVVVGHDWGAAVAWHTALLRPDRIRGVVGMSVPFVPRSAVPPVTAMRRLYGDRYYMVYFQQCGLVDAEFDADPRETIRRVVGRDSGCSEPQPDVVPEGGGFLDIAEGGRPLPPWLTEADLDTYAAQFEASGFTGGLNWYRNLDRNWEITAPWSDAVVGVPGMYIAGDRDAALAGRTLESVRGVLSRMVPDLRGVEFLPGCGHWTPEERPDDVNELLLAFLRSVGG